MVLLTTFEIPSDAVSLGRALAADPSLRIELERVVPTERAVLPFFWVWGGDPTAYEEALREESVVESLTRLDSVGDGTLYRAEWDEDASDLIRGIIETGATLLEATGTAAVGRFQLRFPDRDATASFREFCADHAIPIRVVQVHDLREREHAESTLTDAQREALALAYERGYFETPRAVSLSELGETLGVSPQAVGGRIRRGTANLLRRELHQKGVS